MKAQNVSNDSDEELSEFDCFGQMDFAFIHHEPAFVPPVVKRLARDAETLGEFLHIVQLAVFGEGLHLLDVHRRLLNLDGADADKITDRYERVGLVYSGLLGLLIFYLQILEHIRH